MTVGQIFFPNAEANLQVFDAALQRVNLAP